MAPCTYIRLALGTALGGHICFGSLEFTDIDGPAPVDDLLPSQVLPFRDLDLVADHMGQLCLSKGNVVVDTSQRLLEDSVSAQNYHVELCSVSTEY
jgi:hypothetical protein